ncbi:AraC family two component transcriptional regulator [Natranaerovirga hydrolytica]|uniref:Stage 0 sporulation protein A homolog n=1 Tax=Natranaerovirga hydrolytica TaxID=680378 RepID=A0A4R1MKQ5_9FIRM|nr:response regulator [Natranaerovirga hydrolytica]TCK92630.1 AraC family two component transcriptional regulator [Natranaerovirga hydrolytica]
MIKVLIVDDEPKIRNGLKQWIKQSGYPFQIVGQAKNGKEALDYIVKAQPDFFLVDINMPMLNGLDLIKEIKQNNEKAIVVIVTGYDNFKYAHTAIKLKVDDYLLKPVSKSEFDTVLKSVVDQLGKDTEKKVLECKQYSCLIRNVKNYIENHYDNSQLNLSGVAELFEVNKVYLSKLMKQEMGKSFIEYLTDVRLHKAKGILESEFQRITMYNLATKVGYTSQHYFSRVFKKTFGMSPTEYRDKIKM